jgi:hypothetical protein
LEVLADFFPMSKLAGLGAKCGGLTYLHGFHTHATFDTTTGAAKPRDQENSILHPQTDEIPSACGRATKTR